MKKKEYDLHMALAKELLSSAYSREDKITLSDLKEMCKNYSVEENSAVNFKIFWGQVVKNEVASFLMQTLINTLSEEKRAFLEMKYGRGKNFIFIFMKLNVSNSLLGQWHRQILNDVIQYVIKYRIGANDIFNRLKLINLVEVFDLLLDFFTRVDPNSEFTSREWLCTIEKRRNAYRKIISIMEKAISEDKSGIILLRVSSPELNNGEIADKCNRSTGMVTIKSLVYFKQVEQYLV